MLDYVLIHAGYDIVTDFDEEHTEENTVDLRKIEGNILIDLFK
jgi:hydrogenase maturation factor